MSYATLMAERDARLATLNEAQEKGVKGARFEALRSAYWDASDAVTRYAAKPDKEDQIVRQEGQHMTRLRQHWANCPFRGFPYTPKIDDRCPTIVEVTDVPVVVSALETVSNLIPHVTTGGTCENCMVKQIREKEDGYAVSVYTKPKDKSSKLHGTRRKVATGKRKAA